jgi:raffinose/stachyose/melibiose transport system permease protein
MLDNLLGVALPEAAFALPFTIVILRPFMRAIPGELQDAAMVDGATRLRFFVRILLPLSRYP